MELGIIAEHIHENPIEGIISADKLISRDHIEANAVLLIQQKEHLPTIAVKSQEYSDNSRTAIMEALTASGHLSRIEITGTITEIHDQVLARLLNGWEGSLPKHEQNRRFAELCNELTLQQIENQIIAGELPPSTVFNEISDCPITLDDSTANALGYRTINKKGMVRSACLVDNKDGTYTRLIEQISRSNSDATTTFRFLGDCGITASRNEAPDICALSTPVVYTLDDYVDGVIDIQRRLDKYAGMNVLYGETKHTNNMHVPYERLREESLHREDQIECYIDRLATYEEKIDHLRDQGILSQVERNEQYAEEVRQILRAICVLAPDYAADCFGQEAAVYYVAASDYAASGQLDVMQAMLNNAKKVENTVIFCGVAISTENNTMSDREVDDIGTLISEGKEKWKWSKGVCRIKSCTSPKPTQIGPCSICKSCQTEFDKGNDPTKIPVISDIKKKKSPMITTIRQDKIAI